MHTAVNGPESLRSAEASECAAEQEQFWPFHDLVSADQVLEGSRLTAEKLTELAADIGLDTDTFTECLASGRYTDLVTEETGWAVSGGVRGTPGFVINGLFLIGAQPYEAFVQIIDQELDRLGWEPSPDQTQANTPVDIEGMVVFPPGSAPRQRPGPRHRGRARPSCNAGCSWSRGAHRRG